ncbi:leucine-rich repeat protein, partial [Candidatus Poribacteria bacterium]|nr:leucine-rich repeat protein [Candidatus Poribacteria bacterium]
VVLSALTVLGLSNNQLTSLPVGVFDELSALTNLVLHNNQLTVLSAGVFDGLTALTQLQLNNNQLTTLPTDVFDELSALTDLYLQNNQLTSLSAGAFNGLTALTQLLLNNNQLTTLPAGVFDKLTALTELWLNANQLTSLPADVFDGLSALTQLYLDNNQLDTLSSDVFDGVSGLTSLLLNTNQLTSLPADVFDGLSALSILHLHNNQLSTVSAGVFEGLAALTQLLLSGNSVNPIPLSVSLEKVADGQFKAVAPTGAPFEMVLPLTVTNGSINGGATRVTISKGRVESGTLTVTRTPGAAAAVTVNIGTLPSLPQHHAGYTFLKSAALPLKVISETNTAPVFTDGTSTTRTVVENTAANMNIGTPIAATDADTGDTLTYTLEGTDAASFSIVSTSGQLQTKAALDYETKTSYAVTVSVSDGNGGSDSITVTINVTDVNENSAPVFADGASTTRSVAENTAANTNIGTAIAATDADTGDTLTYTLSGTDAASFSINSTTGQLETKAALDYETKNSYTVTVTVSDGNGGSESITVTITVTDVNETPANTAPVFSEGDSITITMVLPTKGNTEGDYDVGDPLSATDADGDTVTYSLSGTDADLLHTYVFSKSVNGQKQSYVQLTTRGWSLHDANKSSFTVIVTASDRNGGSDSITVTINVTERTQNTAPVFTDGTVTTRTVAENTASGQHIGTAVAATDADNDTLTYTLSGTDAASFGIDSTTGQLKTKAALDYETKNTYTVTLTVSDSSLTDTITVTINVTDVNDTVVVPPSVPVAARTSQVRDAIIAAIPSVNAANQVTAAHLAAITTLNLRNAGITALRADDFSGMTALTDLNLFKNQLSSLPNGIFEGLTSLTTIRLGQNAVDPLPITVTLEKVVEGQFRVVVPTGATFNYVLPINVANGSLNGGVTTVTIPQGSVESGILTVTRTPGTAARVTADIGAFPSLPRPHYGYTLVKSNNLPLAVIRGANTAPVFSDGTTATRSIAENTARGVNIGAPLSATDTDNDTLTYSLSGIDASTFSIISSSGQLQTRAALDYETKATYAVTVSVSDGNGGSDSIAVTINVTDVIENRAPVFTEGSSITRTIAENTASGQHIGTAVAATDADNDTLTYTLSGTDAASFGIDSTTGQLKTKAALDYETKNTYIVTLTVSDGSLTDTIDVTINITNVNELPTPTAICKVGDVLAPGESCTYPDTDAVFSVLDDGKSQWNIPNLPTWLQWVNQTSVSNSMSVSTTVNGQAYHFVAEELADNSWEIKEIADDPKPQPDTPEQPGDTGGIPTLSISTAAPLTEATLHGSIITLNLSSGTFERSNFSIRDAVSVSGINGVTVDTFGIDRVGDRESTIELEYDGNMTANGILTISVGAGAIQGYNGTALTSQIAIPAVTESVTASTAAPLTEATLDESIITLTLSGRKFEGRNSTIRGAVSVSGISGVTVRNFDIDRQSDTEVTVELTFNGNLNADGTLTLTIGADAIAGYNGPALMAQVAVVASTEAPVEPEPPEVPEPPIVTEKPIESDYDHIEGPWLWMIAPGGDIDIDNMSKASEGVITEAQIAQTGVNEGDHFNDLQWTSGRLLPTTVCGILVCSSDNVINVIREIGLTDRDQLNSYSAYALINISSPHAQNDVLMGVGSDDSIKVWLNGSVVYENDVSRRTTGIQNRFRVNLNAGDNLLLIKICNHGALWANNDWGMFFKLYLDTQDYTLSLPTGGTSGQQPQTPQQPQQPINTGGTPTLTVSTASPLKEETLDESVVTLTLSSAKYERSIFDIRDNITVSGISGVTVRSFDIDRESDTEVTMELTYDGDMTTDGTLTLTVGAGAIADYNGPAITAQVSVSAADTGGQTPEPPETPQQPGNTGGTTLSVSTTPPLTEATLHGGIITLNLSSGAFERSSFTIRDAVSVSGINGLTVDTFGVDRVSDTKITVELEYDGNMTANGTLTVSVGAEAIQDYNGAALTSQIAIPAVTESVTASTASPLTEATLDKSIVTLTLSGRKFERRNSTIRGAVSVSGISGVTVRNFDIDRQSDTEVTVELTFNGNLNADGTLTFTVGPDAIAGYNGPALTAQVSVSAGEAPADTGGQNPDPPETPQQPGDKGIPEQPVTTGGVPTLSVSTAAPLTEATLHEGIVTLTLNGGTYERSSWRLRDAVSVSGITGIALDTFDTERVSDTKLTIKLEFDGNINTDSTLTITLGAGAIVDYGGVALTVQIPVTAVSESVTASTAAPLTEATLDESVVTLTLSGRKFERWNSRIRPAVSVSGISGVTVRSFDIDRESDTEVTVELTYDGDMTANGTLTLTVGADAIAGYNGPALTVQVSVSASTDAPADTGNQNPDPPETPQQPETPEQPQQPGNTGGTPTLTASTTSALTEATLHESVVTLTLSGGTYERSRWDIEDAVSVSGISGVTFDSF